MSGLIWVFVGVNKRYSPSCRQHSVRSSWVPCAPPPSQRHSTPPARSCSPPPPACSKPLRIFTASCASIVGAVHSPALTTAFHPGGDITLAVASSFLKLNKALPSYLSVRYEHGTPFVEHFLPSGTGAFCERVLGPLVVACKTTARGIFPSSEHATAVDFCSFRRNNEVSREAVWTFQEKSHGPQRAYSTSEDTV